MDTILSELDRMTLSQVFEGYDSYLLNERKEYEDVNQNGVFNPVLDSIENKRTNAKRLFNRLYNNKE